MPNLTVSVFIRFTSVFTCVTMSLKRRTKKKIKYNNCPFRFLRGLHGTRDLKNHKDD